MTASGSTSQGEGTSSSSSEAGTASTTTPGTSGESQGDTTTALDTSAGEGTEEDGLPHECWTHRDCPPGQACETTGIYGESCVDVECIDDDDCAEGFECYHGTHHIDGGNCEPLPSETSSTAGSSDSGSSDDSASSDAGSSSTSE